MPPGNVPTSSEVRSMLTKSTNENDKNKYLDECAKMCNDARGCEGFSFHLGDRLLCQFYGAGKSIQTGKVLVMTAYVLVMKRKNTEKEKQLVALHSKN